MEERSLYGGMERGFSQWRKKGTGTENLLEKVTGFFAIREEIRKALTPLPPHSDNIFSCG
jgi:hypothetical protein